MTTTTAGMSVEVKYTLKGKASVRIKGTADQVNQVIQLLNQKSETNGTTRNN